MSLLKSTATIGFYTLISRLLGFLRDVTIATSIGASWLSDAFFVAFKIPNFLRRLFAEGAFNAAFVPLFAGMLASEGAEKAKAFADEALSFLIAILIIVSIGCILAMPWLMLVLAPGFTDQPEKYDLTVMLTRITMPYILFISVVSLLGGILNSFQKFAAVAATPIIMNLCLIIVPWAISAYTPTYAHALAIAVFIAGFAQMVWLIVFCKRLGVMPRLKAPKLTAEVKRLFALIAPAAAGAGVAQINLFIDLIIASSLENGVSYLYYADRINELPLAVIGIAVGTALLPMLSRQIREGNHAQANHSQNRAIEIALFLSLPAACALLAMALPIIRSLYEHGQFTVHDSLATAPALMAFAAGLPAFVLIKVLAPAFYANQDTKTPFIIATICIAVNLILNLTLIGPLKHVGMAVATSTAGWLNVTLMIGVLHRRKLFSADREMLRRIPRMLIACASMIAALVLLQTQMQHYWSDPFYTKLMALSALVMTGFAAYMVPALLLHAVEPTRLRAILKRKR